MLKSIYINNYNCLVDFKLELDKANLLLGSNGTGKSSVLSVLNNLTDFVNGRNKLEYLFPTHSKTRWLNSNTQSFELCFEENSDTYHYRLEIEHPVFGGSAKVKTESVFLNQNLLLRSKDNKAEYYTDNNTLAMTAGGMSDMSALQLGYSDVNAIKYAHFRTFFSNFEFVKIVPSAIEPITNPSFRFLTPDCSKFISWLRTKSLEKQDVYLELKQSFAQVFPDFVSFGFEQTGTEYVLRLYFSQNQESTPYTFYELSDGQKVLFVLYSLLAHLKDHAVTLFLDEPDNYITLRELQPLISIITDYCEESRLQVVLISHHPEIINSHSTFNSVLFKRGSTQNTQLIIDLATLSENLPLSEIMARGWENE